MLIKAGIGILTKSGDGTLDRAALAGMDKWLDLIIPRGGKGLI